MKFFNEILDFFKNLTIENAIDIGIGLAIIVIFKIIIFYGLFFYCFNFVIMIKLK